MSKYISLHAWIKNNRVKKSNIISFVDGLNSDVRELSDILGHEIVLAVKKPSTRLRARKHRKQLIKK